MLSFIKTNSFNAVAPGQTATVNLPTSQKYHRLDLIYSRGGVLATEAQMKSDINQVRLKINGKVQRVFSATELFAINGDNGQPVAAGVLPIFFAEPWRRSAQGEDALAWGTTDVDTFQVEVDIDGAAVSPGLYGQVLVDTMNTPLGPIVKWRRQNIPVTATGITTTTTLDKNNGYYRIHAFSTNIDDIAVIVDQERILEATAEALEAHYATSGVSVDASETLIAFDSDQRISSALPMKKNGKQVSEFRVEWNMSSAASFNIISELLGVAD